MGKNYYLHKDNKTGEILYFEYDKIKGYPVTPKTKLRDAIEVNKIIFVNSGLREKLIRKKIDIKLRYFLRFLEIANDDGSDEGAIQKTIMEAEKLRMNILNHYVKYLGHTYGDYTIKKIQLIINQLKIKLYNIGFQKRMMNDYSNELYYLEEEEPMKGRGR